MSPLYDYECLDCKHVFDAYNKIDERMEAECPECGGRCKQLITAFNFKVFKPYIEENIRDKPTLITSSQQLKDEMLKREDETKGVERLVAD